MKITLNKMTESELWLAYRECSEDAAQIKDEIQKRCSIPKKAKRPSLNRRGKKCK